MVKYNKKKKKINKKINKKTKKTKILKKGASGFPETEKAGNVLRKESTLRLSIRIPPGVDGEKSSTLVESLLTQNPPYGSKIDYKVTFQNFFHFFVFYFLFEIIFL